MTATSPVHAPMCLREDDATSYRIQLAEHLFLEFRIVWYCSLELFKMFIPSISEGSCDGVATQVDTIAFQIAIFSCFQSHHLAIGKRFTPEQLVVHFQSGTCPVRIFTPAVCLNVECDVNVFKCHICNFDKSYIEVNTNVPIWSFCTVLCFS